MPYYAKLCLWLGIHFSWVDFNLGLTRALVGVLELEINKKLFLSEIMSSMLTSCAIFSAVSQPSVYLKRSCFIYNML